jgi:mRNA interferase MazF
VTCAPIYSNGAGLETQIGVGIDEGLKHPSWITSDQLMTFRKSDLTNFVGSLSLTKIAELNRALAIALDLR